MLSFEEKDVLENVPQFEKPLPRSLALESNDACEASASALAIIHTKLAVLVIRPRTIETKEKTIAKEEKDEMHGDTEEDTHSKPPSEVKVRVF